MQKSITLSIFVLLTSCGGGSSNNATIPVEVIKPCSIELNADSLMSAAGVPKTGAQMISDIRPKWIIDDRAVGGLSLDALLLGNKYPIYNTASFDKVKHSSDIIVIELGGNDAYIGFTAEQFEANLRQTIRIIKANGKIPVLTGIVPFAPGDVFTETVVKRDIQFNEITHRVASELNIVDARFDTVAFSAETDTIDGIHRTEPALKLLVERLASTIDIICK